MNDFTQSLFDRRDQALDVAGDARSHLIGLLAEAEGDLAAAVADVTGHQSYAAWWMTVTDHIEHGGLDAVTALIRARDAAYCAVLDGLGPYRSMYAHAQALARAEATRRFYHDTTILTLGPVPSHNHPAHPDAAAST